MSELFKDDEMNQLFFDITLTAKQQSMITELVKMNEGVIGSLVFGYVLYDNGTFPVMTNIDRDFFAENYMVILAAMAKAGVYDSYTFLIKQVLGAGVVIEYKTPKPRHLKINIPSIESYESKLVTGDNLWVITSDNLGVVVTKTISEFTVSQLKKVLEILANPSGTYLELTFEPPITLNSVSIDQDFSEMTVPIGETYQFTGVGTYTDDTTITTTESPELFEWSSSDGAILMFDQSVPGLAKFYGIGSVTVTLKSTEDKTITDAIGFDVLDINEFSIVVGSDAGYLGVESSSLIGSFSNDDWNSSGDEVKSGLYVHTYNPSQGYKEILFFSSPTAKWADSDEIIVSLVGGSSSAYAILSFEDRLTGKYGNQNSDDINRFTNLLTSNVGESVEVSILGNTLQNLQFIERKIKK